MASVKKLCRIVVYPIVEEPRMAKFYGGVPLELKMEKMSVPYPLR